MPIVRTYQCEECSERLGHVFRFDKLHFSRDEPPPECPGCQAFEAQKPAPAVFISNRERPVKEVPAGFKMTSNASKAGDITQDILEKDYGLSDIRDRQREGDLAVVTPPHLRPAVDNFFKASGPVIAAAKQGAQAAAAEGSNPFAIVQKAAKRRGTSRVPISPVNRFR